MRRLPGQAARHTGRALHAVCTFALLVALGICAVAGVLSWRLAQGPLDAPWLARRLAAAVNADGGPTRLTIRSAAIAWEGFTQGVDMPLDVRLAGVAATDPAGSQIADIPSAEVSLSVGALLTGELRPRAIELDRARFRVLRAEDGSLSLDLGSLAEAQDATAAAPGAPPPGAEQAGGGEAGPPLLPGLVTELARPAGNDRIARRRSLIGQLRRVRVRNAAIVVVDRQIGATWRIPEANVDLERLKQGGVEGTASVALALGQQNTTLSLIATLAPGGERTQARITMGQVEPAALARAAPGLAALAALNAPVDFTALLDLGPRLAVNDARFDVAVGAGHATLGPSTIAIDRAGATLEGNAGHAKLTRLEAVVRPRDGGQPSTVGASGTVAREGGKFRAALDLTLDQVGFADLATFWPAGAGHGARAWVTENITGGTARDARVSATVVAGPDLADADLASASGTIQGDGLTVHWLRPIPPIEHGRGRLRIIDPDTVEITVDAGQQRPEQPRGTPLTIRNGKMKVTGIEHPHQFGAIEAEIDGGLGEALALLRNPRLRLLDKHPLPFKDASGSANARLSVQIPLEDKVKIDDIGIRADATLADVAIAGAVAGRDIEDGAFDLYAGNDGMKLSGNATFAGIAATLSAAMDFRAGPASQVVQTVSFSGRASAQQMRAAGVDPGPLMGGSAALAGVLTEQRGGAGALEANADLTEAELTAAPLGWRKAAGSPAKASARIALDHDHITKVDALSLEGTDLSVQGRAAMADAAGARLDLDRLVIGRTQGTGSVQFPPRGASVQPIVARFNGPQIDLSAALARRPGGSGATPKPAQAQAKPQAQAQAGPPWTLDARFARALMANEAAFSAVSASLENDGHLFRRMAVEGRDGAGGPFRLEITPLSGGRRLHATAADAGALFTGLDLLTSMRGGALDIKGTYDDARADHPLSGLAEITNFRVRDPHGLGKILQAMTLYGLVQAASGPGLGFDKLTAPFTLTDDALVLGECRAFNPSLGLTATGRIDITRSMLDLRGTIVPAYFFNSLLGNIPLLGRLFSPEKGGGLFAANYTVRGPADAPSVSVNPLSALTPGFLRGLFGGS